MEIPVVAKLQIEEGTDSLEYYYKIEVITLPAESEGRPAPAIVVIIINKIKQHHGGIAGILSCQP